MDIFECPEDLKTQAKLPPKEAIQWGVCFAKMMIGFLIVVFLLAHPTVFGLMFLSHTVITSAIIYVILAFVIGVFLKLRKISKNVVPTAKNRR